MIAALAICSTALAACGGGSSSSSSSAPSTEAETETETSDAETPEEGAGGDAVAEAAAKIAKLEAIPSEPAAAKLGTFMPKPSAKLYLIACNEELEGCKRFADGVTSAAKTLGYSLESCNGTDPQAIAECFTNALNAKPDAAIIDATGLAEAEEGYAALEKEDIPTILTNTGEPPPGVSTEIDNTTCLTEGQAIGNWLIAESEGKANIVAYTSNTFKCLAQRQLGLEESLKTCSECQLKTVQFAIEQITTGLPQQALANLQSEPDVEYITVGLASGALSVADAVRQAGKSEDVTVASFDGDAANLELMRKGEIIGAETTTGLVEDGWLATDAAARVIAGEEVPKGLPGTMILITPSNVNELGGPGTPPNTQFSGVPGFEKKIAALWGK